MSGAKKPKKSRHVLVACFPKSGSTYLCRLLMQITGLQKKTVRRGSPSGAAYWEQDLCETFLQKLFWVPCVVHQHVKGIPPNIHLLRAHDISPIVQVRQIGDVLVSLHDHIANESSAIPITYVPKVYGKFTYDQRLTFLIHATVPWYLSFYTSWKEAARKLDVLWVSYEQLFSSQLDQVQRVVDFCGLEVTSREIEQAIETMTSVDTRKNVGVSGRGNQLSDKHKRLINEHASSWGLSVEDLRYLGLPLSMGASQDGQQPLGQREDRDAA